MSWIFFLACSRIYLSFCWYINTCMHVIFDIPGIMFMYLGGPWSITFGLSNHGPFAWCSLWLFSEMDIKFEESCVLSLFNYLNIVTRHWLNSIFTFILFNNWTSIASFDMYSWNACNLEPAISSESFDTIQSFSYSGIFIFLNCS